MWEYEVQHSRVIELINDKLNQMQDNLREKDKENKKEEILKDSIEFIETYPKKGTSHKINEEVILLDKLLRGHAVNNGKAST